MGKVFVALSPPIKKCEPRRKKFDPPFVILNLFQDPLKGREVKKKRFRTKFGMTEEGEQIVILNLFQDLLEGAR